MFDQDSSIKNQRPKNHQPMTPQTRPRPQKAGTKREGFYTQSSSVRYYTIKGTNNPITNKEETKMSAKYNPYLNSLEDNLKELERGNKEYENDMEGLVDKETKAITNGTLSFRDLQFIIRENTEHYLDNLPHFYYKMITAGTPEEDSPLYELWLAIHSMSITPKQLHNLLKWEFNGYPLSPIQALYFYHLWHMDTLQD